MLRKQLTPTLVVLLLGALGFVAARAQFKNRYISTPTNPRSTFVPAQSKSKPPVRNLALQPDAFRFSRLVGKRFSSERLEESNLAGVLSIAGESKTVQTKRSQTSDGEKVQIALAGAQTPFTWDSKEGSKSSETRATGSDRELIERLVFDSPDQFVLAQLRGASYYTVARNVRAAESSEKNGPLWNIVRVDDPQADEAKRPLSRWRLYYVNVATGLIDRIVSDSEGQRMTATVVWTAVQGEKVPAQIVWKRDGQTVMQYQLSAFAHAKTEGGAK